jgi:hypothetical protein
MAIFDSTGRSRISNYQSVSIQTDWTRPADTSIYAAGDAVTDSTSSPTTLTFTGCAKVNGGSGVIIAATMSDSFNQTTKGDFNLFIFDTTYTADNDNAVFTPTDAELKTCRGVISFSAGLNFVGDATSGSGGNLFYPGALARPIPFTCGAASTSLFGGLVARNAYTPGSAEVFTITLQIEQL